MAAGNVLFQRRSIPRLYVRTPVRRRRHDVITPLGGLKDSKVVRSLDNEDDVSETESNVSSAFTETFDPDADYDYDAEDDISTSMDTSSAKLSMCENLYLNACKLYCVIPVQVFRNQLACTTITVRNHPIGDRGTKALAVALVGNHTVDTLTLAGNDVGPLGAEYLSEVLSESISITNLDLSDNTIGSAGAVALAEMMKTNQVLKKVCLAGNDFNEDAAWHFAEALLVNETLQELDLSYNNFGEHGGLHLKSVLINNFTLKTLTLKWNHFRRLGAKAIAEGLKLNGGLRKLDLSWNGFGIEGCYHMAKALRENTTLKELDLSANRVGMLAVRFLLNGINSNYTLRTLRIGDNPLTTDAAVCILQALGKAEDSTLVSLDLKNVQVDGEFLHMLRVLKEKRRLEVTHGIILRHDEIKEVSKDGVVDEDDPLSVLFEFMKQKNLRLKDLFGAFDKDGSGTISRAEFREGFKHANIPLNKRSLGILMDQLDKNRDGKVDYSELYAGQKENNRRRLMQRVKFKKKRGNQRNPEEALKLRVQGYLALKDKREKEKSAHAHETHNADSKSIQIGGTVKADSRRNSICGTESAQHDQHNRYVIAQAPKKAEATKTGKEIGGKGRVPFQTSAPGSRITGGKKVKHKKRD